MQALRIDGNTLERLELPVPEPPLGEALVRVRLAGICNTDLELARGYMGFRGVPGHEFVGEIVAVPAGSGLVAGQRVVGEINAGCGACEWCTGEHPAAYRPGIDPHRLLGAGAHRATGDSRHCPTRTVLGILGRDGAHAEYLTLPARNLIPLPDGVSDEVAVFVEPLAAACEILDQVPLGRATRALVLGDGKLGLLVSMVLASTGADVLAVGRHEEKLAILARAGVPTCCSDAVPGGRWDLVVEATGSAAGLGQAIELVRPRGTVVLKTTVASPIAIDLAPLVVDEVRLLGSRCGRFAAALDRIARGQVDPTVLISARYPLRDGVAAYERAGRPGSLKVLLEP